jgi:hypothetical protein
VARALEGKSPTREAHGRPPDFPNPQTLGSTIWEPVSVDPQARVRAHQARRPVPSGGARPRPDPWPSPGVIIANQAACLWSALQLEGEQNIHLLSVGSELHAALSDPQSSSFSPIPPVPSPSVTLARENLSCGEALPPSGAPPTFTPNAGNCLMCMLKTWRNQGEPQHRITHLS